MKNISNLLILLLFGCSTASYQIIIPFLDNKVTFYQCIKPNIKIESIQFKDDTCSKNELGYFSTEFKRKLENKAYS